MEYHGRLNAVDSYMNIKLTNTEEWKDGKNEGTLGEVFIRYVPTIPTRFRMVSDFLGVIMFFGSVRMRRLIRIGCSKINLMESLVCGKPLLDW